MSIWEAFVETKEKNQPKIDDNKSSISPATVNNIPVASSSYIPYNNGSNNLNGSNDNIIPTAVDSTPKNSGMMNGQQMQDHLLSEISKRSYSGYHYLLFRSSTESLKQFIPDEKARLTAAFVNAKTMTPDASATHLLETADQCVSALQEEHQKFDSELQNVIQQQITSRQNQITNCETTISDCEKQITDLQNKIEESKQNRAKLMGETVETQQKINDNKTAFQTAFDTLNQSIQNDKTKIQQYLLTAQ